MRARSTLLSVITCLLAFAAFASTASADTYCVGTSACGSSGHNYAMDKDGLTQALADTEASTGVNDTILIGAGTITINADLEVLAPITNRLTIQGGSGGGTTVLHFPNVENAGLTFDAGNPNSMITNLTVAVDGGTGDPVREGIRMYGGVLNTVHFEVGSVTDTLTSGARLTEGANCTYCTFSLMNDGAVGINITGAASVVDSDFTETSDDTSETYGVTVSSGSDATITRSQFIEIENSIDVFFGTLEVTDSIIDMGEHDGATGVLAKSDPALGGEQSVTVDGVTIVGADDDQSGVRVESEGSGAAESTGYALVANSLFFLQGDFAEELHCHQSGTSTGELLVAYSLRTAGWDAGSTCATTDSGDQGSGGDNLSADATTASSLFVDWDGGDLRLAPGAVVIDRGFPMTNLATRLFDAVGGVRSVGINGNPARIDMGGVEYQNYKPEQPDATVTPKFLLTGESIQYDATTTDANGDTVTWLWNFGDGGTSDTASGSHKFTTAGTFTVTVWANDGQYQSDPREFTVTVVAVGGSPAPGADAGGRARSDCCSVGAGYTNAKFTTKKGAKLKNGFAVSTTKPKSGGFLPITTTGKMAIKLNFAKPNGGYLVDGTCKAKQGKTGSAKRCTLTLPGTQTVELPAGTSYLTFGGKWNKKSLPSGKYTLIGVNPTTPTNTITVKVTYTAKAGKTGKAK
jgi:hypothetical protein